MASLFKVGDLVRVKQMKGDQDDYPNIFSLKKQCLAGLYFHVQYVLSTHFTESAKRKPFYNGDDFLYFLDDNSGNSELIWHSSMLEKVSEINTTLKKGDLVVIREFCGQICKNPGGYFLDFSTCENSMSHGEICKTLRNVIPQFKEIASSYSPNEINTETCFPEFKSIDDLVSFVQQITKPKITSLTTKNQRDNEIRFQKPKTSVVRGFVPKGYSICGRRCKTAIVSRHLGHRTCYF